MRRPGRYVFEVECTHVDLMWEGTGVDCPTVAPFLESVLFLFPLPLLCQGMEGLGSTVPRKVLHTYTLSCHCCPEVGCKSKSSCFFFVLAQLLVYLLLTDNILSGVLLRLDCVGLLSSAIGQNRLTTFFCSYQS
ncbi:hypothetical protein Tc00.1047053511221.20 [Trypanosoma cruzi]|uniref:Uncharacterized protein n=1 Tax=Trypanosoma cruzi (strain CL Brener) TaxID=353153 RepID=Q4D783_TRYCC|nr:hypothetical protein Tc00.1047053511221.20 [Trypanosoma cruzi]EAN88384.1 hypothetical protein Tc00.1047053511221.20 [Trypanosoma cruzi]|eukprot:XP_810235.1 hypothetical protein [Trypanosoma cruzi strain CL Brener]